MLSAVDADFVANPTNAVPATVAPPTIAVPHFATVPIPDDSLELNVDAFSVVP